jgi:hypothetical protein
MALADPRTGIDPFAQFRVPTRLHAYPSGRILVRVGRIASVVHIGSCWNAFIWLRNESCKQTW